jgi:molybdopterin biosynthesis enzyme MoaB
VIVDYLASEAASEHLELSLTSDSELMSGGKVRLTLKATTSLTEKPLPGVHVSIRVVSTVRPPQILFRGVTGADGSVSSICALPDIGAGNAALIIAASSPLGNNEIKQLIKKRK